MIGEKAYHHGDLKNALIEAGIEVLARDGIYGFSLRKVAQKAGVSHSAPYAHFADKQGLIAAISSEGYRKILARLEAVERAYGQETMVLFVRTAWEYVQFATQEPEHFRITLSGAVEKEKSYPDLVDAAQKSFGILLQVTARCQADGILHPGPADLAAVSVWGAIHGLVILVLDGQVSHATTGRYSWKQMLLFSLGQLSQKPIPQEIIDSL